MKTDVIIIGAGISGLTAASLLAKRKVNVLVIDKSYNPGGSCGTFKRNNITFDQGSAMLYGFGEKGFNPHRFVFNSLEQPIDIVKHEYLYNVNYMGNRIRFYGDIAMFADELARVFPNETRAIHRFYHDMSILYQHVMVENPVFSSADEVDPKKSLKSLLRHPLSYAKFLSFLNMNAKTLLKRYFADPEIFNFFDKLTSTYCYTTVEETPAILAAIMFVDNHIGGSYYPAGSTVFLPGKLEKVIEENGGTMMMEKEVTKILFDGKKPCGVRLNDGTEIFAPLIIYSGTVWNLYGKLIDQHYVDEKRLLWAKNMVPTYPSVVMYAYVDKEVIPADTMPIEFLVGNPHQIDESEVTVYINSIDDSTLCDEDGHVIMAIGPTLEKWDFDDPNDYNDRKEKEAKRLSEVLEKRFPGFTQAIRFYEIATPRTIERYTNKNGGAVAGPKQMIGQHMFQRMHIRSEWDTLFCCGESTVMGTGTPTVTISGLSAANAVLKKLDLPIYEFHENMPNFVNLVDRPVKASTLNLNESNEVRQLMKKAAKCQFCEKPMCMTYTDLDIRGIMRRVSVGNIIGAKRIIDEFAKINPACQSQLLNSQDRCIQNTTLNQPVEIKAIFDTLRNNF